LDPFNQSNNVVAIVDHCPVTTANWVIFGIFVVDSSLGQAPSSLMEVMTRSEFGFMVFSWVGWIHSHAEIMLLPLSIVAQ